MPRQERGMLFNHGILGGVETEEEVAEAPYHKADTDGDKDGHYEGDLHYVLHP